MALHWPTFFTRLGSAIIFCLIMMTGLLWHESAFLMLIAIIQVLCLKEYFGLVKKIQPDAYWPKWVPWFAQILGLVWLLMQSPVLLGKAFSPILAFFPILLIILTTYNKKNAWYAGISAVAGLVYVVLPIVLFFSLRMQSILIPLALVLMIWMNDTMAYLVGSFIGKTPFSEISPKKTWEGTLGGAILTIVGAAVWSMYTPHYEMIDWMVLALCASVAGTAGDLLQSKLKRMAGVKDSGKLMPGHGGALDRFDSIIVAIPFAYTYAYMFMENLPLTIF